MVDYPVLELLLMLFSIAVAQAAAIHLLWRCLANAQSADGIVCLAVILTVALVTASQTKVPPGTGIPYLWMMLVSTLTFFASRNFFRTIKYSGFR